MIPSILYNIQTRGLRLASFVLLILSFSLKSQEPYYYNIAEESGLPSSEVYQVIQDDFGFIWLGTDAGLFRYDGIHFKHFKSKTETSRSISGLRLDRNGMVWCQNFSGQIFKVNHDSLSLFASVSDEFKQYPQFTIDDHMRLWVCGETKIVCFDTHGKKIESLSPRADNGLQIAWSDIEFDSGKLIITSTNNGLYKLDVAGSQRNFVLLDNRISLCKGRSSIIRNANDLTVITENSQGETYSVHTVGKSGNVITQARYKAPEVIYYSAFITDSEQWLGTGDGVLIVNNASTRDSIRHILKGEKVSCIFRDREHNIWLSTLQNGLYVIPNKELNVFTKQNSILKDNYVTHVTEAAGGDLYLGVYSGKTYCLQQSNTLKEVFVTPEQGYRAVKKIAFYKGGSFVSRGVFSFNSTRGNYVFNTRNIRDFLIYKGDLYYAASHNAGVIRHLDEVMHLKTEEKNTEVLLNSSSRSLALDTLSETVYFATIEGLYAYTHKELKKILFNGSPINATKIEFHDGKLWIATINDGFITLENGKLQKPGKLNAYLKNLRIKTFKISSHDLWVATETNLCRISLQDAKISTYDYSNGILSKEINDIIVSGTEVSLATNKGLICFSGESTHFNFVAPSICITDMLINDSLLNISSGKLSLDYHQNKVQIKFIAACFKARGNFSYKYRMQGLDSSWTTIKAIDNQVLYSALPAGNFIFQVKAVNEDGIESLNPATMLIHVKAPYWQSIWYYILLVICSVTVVILVAVMVVRDIRKKAGVQNELVASQHTAIRAQMNPHFMYNTLNSIQDLILKNDLKNTNYYLSKFSTLMRKVLDFSSAEHISVAEEVEMLQDYLMLEKLRFGEDFNYTLDVADDINPHKADIPTMIIQPFVENAIKHGLLHKKSNRILEVRFMKKENTLVVTITDNGVGRQRSEEIRQRGHLKHKSFATSAVNRRIALLNERYAEKISVSIEDLKENEISTGTRVIITLPYSIHS